MANLIQILDVIDRLPGELAAALEADPFFEDIPVILAEAGNVRLEMERKQAVITAKQGKRGVAVIVLQMVGDDEYPEQAFGPLTLRPAFQVLENPELNNDGSGTGKSQRRVARKIVQIIKPLALYGLATEFVPDKPCIEPVDLEQELGPLIKASQVNFKTFEAASEVVSQVATPQIAPFADVTPKFQITCATAGAVIYYSIDDSFPAPGRDTCAEYSGPIDIPADGVTVRCAAYKAGLIGSQVNRALVEVEN